MKKIISIIYFSTFSLMLLFAEVSTDRDSASRLEANWSLPNYELTRAGFYLDSEGKTSCNEFEFSPTVSASGVINADSTIYLGWNFVVPNDDTNGTTLSLALSGQFIATDNSSDVLDWIVSWDPIYHSFTGSTMTRANSYIEGVSTTLNSEFTSVMVIDPTSPTWHSTGYLPLRISVGTYDATNSRVALTDLKGKAIKTYQATITLKIEPVA